jgi:2-(1,2-epoxy-1,2-dihydrophenyl)acetyl-CoA isomerase
MKPGDVAAKAGEALLKHYNPLLKRLRDLPIPVVAAVNGVAAGAGCNFALAADIVLAARSATFVEAFARIGLIPHVGGTLEQHYNPLIRKLKALPFPVVAAVNGVAAGAGANIALACDIVLAAQSATFIQSFAKVGLVPDSGGTWHLPRLVGMARARGLALLAEPLPARKAEDWGLIWKAIDDAALMDEAHKLCAHFASAPTYGLSLIKRALNASADNTLDQQLDLERDSQRDASLAPDYQEGVQAFMNKRKPNFTGRR